MDTIGNTTPLLICVLIFGVYIAAGNTLTSAKAYSVLAYFNLLLVPLRMLLFSVLMLVNAKSSMQRIDHFLQAEERLESNVQLNSNLPHSCIQITGGEFQWENISAAEHDKRGKLLQMKMRQPGGNSKKPVPDSKGGGGDATAARKEEKDKVEELKLKDLRIL